MRARTRQVPSIGHRGTHEPIGLKASGGIARFGRKPVELLRKRVRTPVVPFPGVGDPQPPKRKHLRDLIAESLSDSKSLRQRRYRLFLSRSGVVQREPEADI